MFLRAQRMDPAASRYRFEAQLDAIAQLPVAWEVARELVGRLNQTATPGRTFADAIEAGKRASMHPHRDREVDRAARWLLDDTLQKALAVLLLIMHQHQIPGARLSDTLLALVMAQTQDIDPTVLARIQPRLGQIA